MDFKDIIYCAGISILLFEILDKVKYISQIPFHKK